ncbi:hypothetical protein GWK08_13905 [Leptobacterium flavescens]|uniref:Uncharacterized protein n=1 Tax=Leptobacterium flavescens TaxID=472055 RepID=A0A6P0UMR3_9FLAO|nr:hypothetical protein [Leptobacterium flavescens]NER14544.1 hypothetical protein [Leptobacterium flavescens]
MKKSVKIGIGTIILIVLINLILYCGAESFTDMELDRIENELARDSEEQYKIAKENGDAMDAYLQAGLTAQAYLMANDKENYNKWKEIEKKEAKNAGLR